MILKSFYHKKSTKVYLIIITITIIAIMSMFLYKNKIINMENIANEYSYVFLYSKCSANVPSIGTSAYFLSLATSTIPTPNMPF